MICCRHSECAGPVTEMEGVQVKSLSVGLSGRVKGLRHLLVVYRGVTNASW